MNLLLAVLFSSALVALAANNSIAMGPDPGGHSGATVTPETTKTDSPAVDAARQSTAGSKTETNVPANPPKEARKK